MDRISREDLRALLRAAKAHCVSIYVPTHVEASWVEHDRIALKNLIGEAARLLISDGMRRPDADALLGPAVALLHDSFFWRHLGKGLAAFASADTFRAFRLPISFEAKAVVAARFHVRPLLDIFTGEGEFYVLSLSTKRPRLYKATRFAAESVEMPGGPTDLADELRFDDFEKHVEFRTGAPGGGGAPTATFFGHGGTSDSVKEELLRYFRDVDKAMHRVLRTEHAPVVLAGVRYFQALFREASPCRYVVDGGVEGSPEQLGEAGMIERARELVGPIMKTGVAMAMDRYRASAGKGLASSVLEEVVRAARAGRVGMLLSARGQDRWGRLDPETGRISTREHPEPGDEDLTELAAAETVSHGGAVYLLDRDRMPEGAVLAAVYRY